MLLLQLYLERQNKLTSFFGLAKIGIKSNFNMIMMN